MYNPLNKYVDKVVNNPVYKTVDNLWKSYFIYKKIASIL